MDVLDEMDHICEFVRDGERLHDEVGVKFPVKGKMYTAFLEPV